MYLGCQPPPLLARAQSCELAGRVAESILALGDQPGSGSWSPFTVFMSAKRTLFLMCHSKPHTLQQVEAEIRTRNYCVLIAHLVLNIFKKLKCDTHREKRSYHNSTMNFQKLNTLV